MAKRGGIFQAFGTLFRVAVWGLAGVFVLAIWLGWSRDETAPAVETEATAPADGVAVIEIEPEAPAAAEAEATAQDAPAPAAPAENAAAPDPAAPAEAVAETGDIDAAGALAMPADLTLPGDPATYRFLGLSAVADGQIEVATVRLLDGATTYETRRIGCEPLTAGVVAAGDSEEALGERNETPEMAAVAATDAAVAAIAAAACGALKGEASE